MGASQSNEFDAESDLNENDSLLLFARELPIPEGDPFWDTFLTFTLKPPTSRYTLSIRGFTGEVIQFS